MNINTGFQLQPDGRWLIDKDPEDSLYYGRDISSRFPGRTLASAVATAAGGVTAGTAAVDGTVASVLVSGGTLDTTGTVALECTLDNGEITNLTMHFRIVAR